MSQITEQETVDARIHAMGKNLGETHNHLYRCLLILNHQWVELKALFGPNPERAELLNSTAPWTFKILRDALWEDILMGICRLADPAESQQRGVVNQNVSMRGMASQLSTDCTALVQDDLDVFMRRVEPIKRMRDKAFSHADRDTVLRGAPNKLDPIEMKLVEDILACLALLLNKVEVHYLGGGPVVYDLPRLGGGGAETLLMFLEEGLQAVRKKYGGLQ